MTMTLEVQKTTGIVGLLEALSAEMSIAAVSCGHLDSALGQLLEAVPLESRLKVMQELHMEGRGVGTPGGAKARAYIVKRFGQIGLRPAKTSLGGAAFERPFSFKPRFGREVSGVNLVARIEGTSSSDKVLVVSAHYDHLGVRKGQVYNGADDNASGIAGLLAVAEAFKARPPRHTVLIVAFDAEESGLKGAKAFVADPPVPLARIGLNVNFDMMPPTPVAAPW